MEEISTDEMKSVLVKAKALLEKEREIEKASRIAAVAAAAAAAQEAAKAAGIVDTLNSLHTIVSLSSSL